MIVFPNAKINLGLQIVSKRSDGYHNLKTVFYPIHTCTDALEILQSDTDFFEILGKEVAGNWSDNLVWKAVTLLRQDYEVLRQPLHLVLHKQIPMGAGLGGGSADASFALMALNQKFELDISKEKLAEYALALGSDCPFFLYNRAALARGRGEQLRPIRIQLDKFSLQVFCVPLHISTAEVFQNINPRPPAFDLQMLEQMSIDQWKNHLTNDFEESVFSQHPILAELKQNLYRQGALYASLTGTGAAVYGIFRKKEQASIDGLPPGTEIFYQE